MSVNAGLRLRDGVVNLLFFQQQWVHAPSFGRHVLEPQTGLVVARFAERRGSSGQEGSTPTDIEILGLGSGFPNAAK